jgi:hypothetical protein
MSILAVQKDDASGSPTVVTELAEAPFRERRREFLVGSQGDVTQELLKIIQRQL